MDDEYGFDDDDDVLAAALEGFESECIQTTSPTANKTVFQPSRPSIPLASSTSASLHFRNAAERKMRLGQFGSVNSASVSSNFNGVAFNQPKPELPPIRLKDHRAENASRLPIVQPLGPRQTTLFEFSQLVAHPNDLKDEQLAINPSRPNENRLASGATRVAKKSQWGGRGGSSTQIGTQQLTLGGSGNRPLKLVNPSARVYEPAHPYDSEAIKTWIYPVKTSHPERVYQFNIARKALFTNTLVSLPTGLGKTFIAAVVIYNFYRWFPEGKIVFLAPTKPLVHQQISACRSIMGISSDRMASLTGDQLPEMRKLSWDKQRIFFMTPECFKNDLNRGSAPTKKVVLVVVDEAHRATGQYAYCECIKELYNYNQNFRILALSATPGQAVQDVVNNLKVANIEIRSEDSPDLREYTYERITKLEVVPRSKELNSIMTTFEEMLSLCLGRLVKAGAFYSADVERVSANALRMAKGDYLSRTPNANHAVMGDFGVAAKMSQAYDLLSRHGIGSFFSTMDQYVRESQRQPKMSYARRQLINNPQFLEMMKLIKIMMEDESFSGHPKLDRVVEVVLDHFEARAKEVESGQALSKDTRVMIFTEFRESVEAIMSILKKHEPNIRASAFVGQSKGSGEKGMKGMKQREQLEAIRKFESGIFNTLVATSIGEEGLDIGEIDLIICYDVQISPVRMLQRMGRTGRKRDGRIVLLMAEVREQAAYNRNILTHKRIQKTILDGKVRMFTESPRIIPHGCVPEVLRQAIEAEDDLEESSLVDTKKKRISMGGKDAVAFLSCDEMKEFTLKFQLPANKIVQNPSLGKFLHWQNTDTGTFQVPHSIRTLEFIRLMGLCDGFSIDQPTYGADFDKKSLAHLNSDDVYMSDDDSDTPANTSKKVISFGTSSDDDDLRAPPTFFTQAKKNPSFASLLGSESSEEAEEQRTPKLRARVVSSSPVLHLSSSVSQIIRKSDHNHSRNKSRKSIIIPSFSSDDDVVVAPRKERRTPDAKLTFKANVRRKICSSEDEEGDALAVDWNRKKGEGGVLALTSSPITPTPKIKTPASDRFIMEAEKGLEDLMDGEDDMEHYSILGEGNYDGENVLDFYDDPSFNPIRSEEPEAIDEELRPQDAIDSAENMSPASEVDLALETAAPTIDPGTIRMKSSDENLVHINVDENDMSATNAAVVGGENLGAIDNDNESFDFEMDFPVEAHIVDDVIDFSMDELEIDIDAAASGNLAAAITVFPSSTQKTKELVEWSQYDLDMAVDAVELAAEVDTIQKHAAFDKSVTLKEPLNRWDRFSLRYNEVAIKNSTETVYPAISIHDDKSQSSMIKNLTMDLHLLSTPILSVESPTARYAGISQAESLKTAPAGATFLTCRPTSLSKPDADGVDETEHAQHTWPFHDTPTLSRNLSTVQKTNEKFPAPVFPLSHQKTPCTPSLNLKRRKRNMIIDDTQESSPISTVKKNKIVSSENSVSGEDGNTGQMRLVENGAEIRNSSQAGDFHDDIDDDDESTYSPNEMYEGMPGHLRNLMEKRNQKVIRRAPKLRGSPLIINLSSRNKLGALQQRQNRAPKRKKLPIFGASLFDAEAGVSDDEGSDDSDRLSQDRDLEGFIVDDNYVSQITPARRNGMKHFMSVESSGGSYSAGLVKSSPDMTAIYRRSLLSPDIGGMSGFGARDKLAIGRYKLQPSRVSRSNSINLNVIREADEEFENSFVVPDEVEEFDDDALVNSSPRINSPSISCHFPRAGGELGRSMDSKSSISSFPREFLCPVEESNFANDRPMSEAPSFVKISSNQEEFLDHGKQEKDQREESNEDGEKENQDTKGKGIAATEEIEIDNEFVILVDTREVRCSISSYLRNNHQIRTEIRQLAIGDYILSNRMAVERKTISDLMGSTFDKRVFGQISALKAAYSRPVMIIEEAKKDDLFARDPAKRKQYEGIIASLTRMPIRLFFTEGVSETASLLYKLCKSEHSAGQSIRVPKKLPDKRQDCLLRFLMSIPGVGDVTSLAMTEILAGGPGSISNNGLHLRELMHMPASELCRRIPGLTRARARQIVDYFATKFVSNEDE